MTTTAFSSLPLTPGLLASIESLDYQVMTAIQAQSLPTILNGRDLLAQAKTGSGKTAAFAIGILHKLEAKTYQTQALVLCPTRELADQVSKDLRLLARAVFVVDQSGIVRHIQLVKEVAQEPDYDAVIQAVKKLL